MLPGGNGIQAAQIAADHFRSMNIQVFREESNVIKDLTLPAAELPVIDESRLLSEFGGSREILAELRDLFLEHAPPLYESISKAVTEGELAVIAADGHSLKGACATYGAPRLAEVCKEMELAAKAGDLETVQAYQSHFEEEYQKVFESIKTMG